MKKTIGRLAACALLLLWAVPGWAQTADEIIEKHLAASGGRAALAKLTSRTSIGTIALTTPAGEITGTIEVYARAPNKSRTLIKLDLTALGAGEIVVDQRFDGKAGYVIDTFNGNREMTGSQLEAIRNTSSFPTLLLNYRDSGSTVALTGRQAVGGKDAYVLLLTPKAGPPVRLFIDAASLMLVRTDITVNVPELGGDVDQVVEFSDFRDVDGLKMPYAFRSTNPAQTVTATLKDVKHNTAIDDNSFLRPSGQ